MTIAINPVATLDVPSTTLKDIKTAADIISSNQVDIKDYVCLIENMICDLANLDTDDQSCIVSAINELHTEINDNLVNLQAQIDNVINNLIVYESLTDLGGGSYSFDDGTGNLTNFFIPIATITDNGNGNFTFDDGNGTTITFWGTQPTYASTTVAGIVEMATMTEVRACTDTTRYVNPANLCTYISEEIAAARLLISAEIDSDIATARALITAEIDADVAAAIAAHIAAYHSGAAAVPASTAVGSFIFARTDITANLPVNSTRAGSAIFFSDTNSSGGTTPGVGTWRFNGSADYGGGPGVESAIGVWVRIA